MKKPNEWDYRHHTQTRIGAQQLNDAAQSLQIIV
jgi:hypothetical protein